MSLPIEVSPFGETVSGIPVHKITLTNPHGMSAQILSYGATISSVMVRDKQGTLRETTLGFDSLLEYEIHSPYFGSTIGRVANRISDGRFQLEGRAHLLALNGGFHHLHGGFKGYDKRVWSFETGMTSDGPSVRFSLLDEDGAEGYPGSVRVTLIVTVSKTNALKLQYFATTDQPTPINLTNHAYWNLKDAGASPITTHSLRIFSDHYLEVDSNLIPTGAYVSLDASPMDFGQTKSIGQDIATTGGFDHNYIVRGDLDSLKPIAELSEEISGLTMNLWSTEPGVQFYSGNFLNAFIRGRAGTSYDKWHGLCLETQRFPDSVNHPHFPSTILRPGETYRQITEYRF